MNGRNCCSVVVVPASTCREHLLMDAVYKNAVHLVCVLDEDELNEVRRSVKNKVSASSMSSTV